VRVEEREERQAYLALFSYHSRHTCSSVY